MAVCTVSYWNGTLPEEWHPLLDELVDIEIFCKPACRSHAITELLESSGWRKCLDRVDLLVGPVLEDDDSLIYFAQLEEKSDEILDSLAACGYCDSFVVG